MTDQSVFNMHLSVAEAGKLFALKNNHSEALRHYREAIRICVSTKAPEIFFRHYTQCVLESLEMTKGYAEIIQFCRDADTHYETQDSPLDIHKKDRGSISERLGMCLIKSGALEEGKEALLRAVELCGAGVLPVSEKVLEWMTRGYDISEARILSLQKSNKYFVVRKGEVNKAISRVLPKGGDAFTPIPTL